MGLSVAEKIRLIMKRQKITMGDLAVEIRFVTQDGEAI